MTGAVNTEQNTVIVPNVEGITLEVAAQILRTVGLQSRFQNSSSPSAIVVRQDPRPGFSLPTGGEVVLSTGAATGTSQESTGSRTLQYIPSASSQSGVPVMNTGTNVYVAPRQITQQSSRVLAYQSPQGGQSQILYQPPQPRISRYLVAETKPRFYPGWYPRQFLTPVSPQELGSRLQSESMRIAIQPQVNPQAPVSPYFVPDTEPQVYPLWYPEVFLPQDRSQDSVILSQPEEQQWLGVFEVSSTHAVPVPNLLRLRQEDANSAINKAGLALGNVTRVQSSQVRPGIVVKQSPQARAIVPAGTKVDLWIAN